MAVTDKPRGIMPLDATTVSPQAPLRVLVVDDDSTNRSILEAMLKKDGHAVLTAADGQEAVEVFQQAQPDMVLMDVMMPRMDGYEATRRIKACVRERFVPVLFLTALHDEHALVQCVESGGDDFLMKPYKRTIVRAKIQALERIRQLYVTVQTQKDCLIEHAKRMQYEHEVAEKLFAALLHSGCLDAPHIQYLLSPMALFNGDLLFAAYTPTGGLHVMVGDFTGHGLPAAVGALPTSHVFYTMTAKGHLLGDIVTEINHQLSSLLPSGIFCAACLLAFDPTYCTINVWNGGLPDVLIHRPDGTELRRLVSRHLPLGILKHNQFDPGLDVVTVETGDRILVYTDGVIEASNAAGELFGQERLESYITPAGAPANLFAAICNGLKTFCHDSPQRDDLTLIEITCDAPLAQTGWAQSANTQTASTSLHWRFALDLGLETLRTTNPLPKLMQALMEIEGLHPHRKLLYTVLTELYTNALDHGILGLDASLKHTAEGFFSYYTEREKRLADLKEGTINILVEHLPLESGGQLRIEVEDSGPGFDYQRCLSTLENALSYNGRGISLISAICQSLTYRGHGNIAEAVYVWR